MDLLISASLETKSNKSRVLSNARTKVEIIKRLIRLTNDLKIVDTKKYIDIESELQEISRMINGWIKYLK